MNNRSIGKAVIDLKDHNEHIWGQVALHSDSQLLIGMYEDGKVARHLFFMNKEQVKQLANLLTVLSETMD